ncbi:MAG: uroporphyrinogen-III C-methyltransferase [Oligoflexia bacterium]|nr:uroporphyrinogen-III C-methyltransferase [Oligoflexia bacterium]
MNKVYLVGAGPGDPQLLTLKAYEVMQRAEVIAYDALIAKQMLDFLHERFSQHAELIPVGYRGYHQCAQKQQIKHGIHPLVLEKAKMGLRVVRLKSGDPFIFGRGLQECQDLLASGLHFEVIPGVTAAIGASSALRFPLTAIGISSLVTFASGHKWPEAVEGESELRSQLQQLAKIQGTLVLYMAFRKLEQIFSLMIDCGFSADTPAMLVISATTDQQQSLVANLSNLAQEISENIESGKIDYSLPGIIIIGEVVGLYQKIGKYLDTEAFTEALTEGFTV